MRISVTEFRARYRALLDTLPSDGLVVTKRWRPVARILPCVEHNRDFAGVMPNMSIRGDILSTGEIWDATR